MTNAPDLPENQKDVASVEELAEEFLCRLRNGESPAIEDYVQAHPSLEDEIRDVFEALETLEGIAPANQQSVAPKPIKAPETIGEYRIVRELGRGGMGVVYEAEHETMRRRVALKVLQMGSTAREQDRDRFVREARLAGRLHHTNIVPVYEVGTDGEFQYYSMQLISGQNLDLVIHDLRRLQMESQGKSRLMGAGESPAMSLVSGNFKQSDLMREMVGEDISREALVAKDSANSINSKSPSASRIVLPDSSEISHVGQSRDSYFHRVAQVGLQIVDAIRYAHSHGILHRDIKPSNLLLDSTGTIWVTDFGLARTETDGLTLSGNIVGTLRYMAPERMRGKADTQSDIYSIGLTLYELCVLRPAHSASEQADLVRQITSHAPSKPSSIDSSIPRDLETIVLKAIEREPIHRYRSAQAMADDLRLFLEDRPVQARRTSPLEQAWRWSRRNPSLAALMSCVACLLGILVLGSIAYGVASRRHAQELTQETDRALEAEQSSLENARDAQQAKLAAQRALYSALLSEANASRWSRRVGQRYETLQVIKAAAALLPELEFSLARKQQEQLRLRNAAIAVLRLVDVKPVHSWEVGEKDARLALSEDGSRYARAHADGRVVVHATADHALLAEVQNQSPVWWLALDAEGKRLCGLSERTADVSALFRMWDVNSGKVLYETPLDRGGGIDLSSEVNRCALIRDDTTIEIRSLTDGRRTQELKTELHALCLRFSPDGKRLAIATHTRDGQSQIEIHTLDSNETKMISCSFPAGSIGWASNERLCLGGRDRVGKLELIDLKNPETEPLQITAHHSNVSQVDSSGDGRLLKTSSWDGTQAIWNSRSGERLLTFDKYGTTAYGGFCSNSSLMPFAVKGQRVGIWEVATGGPLASIEMSRDTAFWALEVSPTLSNLIAVSVRGKNRVEFWDIESLARIGVLQGESAFMDLAFTPNGSHLITGSVGQGALRRWPLELTQVDSTGDLRITTGSAEELVSVERPTGRAQRFSLDSRGRKLAVAYSADAAQLFEVSSSSNKLVSSTGTHRSLERATLSPDGTLVATTTWQGKGIRIWSVADGKLVHELLPDGIDPAVSFSPDGCWFAASTRQGQFIWQVSNWQRRELPEGSETGHRGALAFSPDSRYLLTNHSRALPRLVDVKTLEVLAVLDSGDSALGICKFASNGEKIITVGTGSLRIWDLKKLRIELEELGLNWN